MTVFKLESNRKKGINAYLCKIKGMQTDPKKMLFGKPDGEENKAKANRSKQYTAVFDLAGMSGDYLYKEVDTNGREKYGWLQIQNGEILNEWGDENEYAIARATKICPELLPLEGSEKQIDWATPTRAKAILIMAYKAVDSWSVDQSTFKLMAEYPHAKDWIEKLGPSSEGAATLLINKLSGAID